MSNRRVLRRADPAFLPKEREVSTNAAGLRLTVICTRWNPTVTDALLRSALAALEAEAAFGDGSLYLEKVVAPARHVEIQVLADGQGGVLTLGERECSIQRRHQKLIEESPSPALDDDTREAMEAAAERACRTIGYRNAGTFEFLLGPNRSFYFIELNARLQVEHPVTELVTGIDIVQEQIRYWKIESLQGLNELGRKAQEKIMGIPARLKRIAEYMETRSKSKTFSFEVVFNREFAME